MTNDHSERVSALFGEFARAIRCFYEIHGEEQWTQEELREVLMAASAVAVETIATLPKPLQFDAVLTVLDVLARGLAAHNIHVFRTMESEPDIQATGSSH